MRTDLPAAHITQAHALEARAYVDLVELDMISPTNTAVYAYLCAQKQTVWQGKTWQRFEYNISDYAQHATGETSRPKFTIINPSGVFSRYAFQGYLDNAMVSRYRVLRPDVDANVNSFQFFTWRISRLISVSKNIITAELRSVLDGHTFYLPTRTYRPPEFLSVSMK